MSLEFLPFSLKEILENDPPVPPEDLGELVGRLGGIPRFVDEKYPLGIFYDNDRAHVSRLVVYAGLASVRGVDKKRLSRMLWIHDIPELEIGDVISPRKDLNIKEAERLKLAEKIAASSLLVAEDVELLEDFNICGDFLRGKNGDYEDLSAEGLVSSVLDKIDGNMFFHYSLARWVCEGDGDREIPSRTALEYTFEQRDQFIQVLEKVRNKFPGAVDSCLFFIDRQMEYVIGVWESVPENKRPQSVNDQLHELASTNS